MYIFLGVTPDQDVAEILTDCSAGVVYRVMNVYFMFLFVGKCIERYA